MVTLNTTYMDSKRADFLDGNSAFTNCYLGDGKISHEESKMKGKVTTTKKLDHLKVWVPPTTSFG